MEQPKQPATMKNSKGPGQRAPSQPPGSAITTDSPVGYPGVVVRPDGGRMFVMDKWAYYRQYPGAYRKTQEDINATTLSQKRGEYQWEQQQAKEEAREKGKVAAMPPGQGEFNHYCVKGYVVKNCEKCKATMKTGQGVCGTCNGKKILYEPCPQCNNPATNRR